MAETTSARFGLRRWSASTDTPSRAEIDGNFGAIETLGAQYAQGTFALRPAPAIAGRFYWDTTNSTMWFDTGAAWVSAGGSTQDMTIRSSTASLVPLTVNAATGQTANLQKWQINGVDVVTLSKDGDMALRKMTLRKGTFDNTGGTTTDVVMEGKGAVSQSGELLRLRNSADANMFSVSAAGVVTAANMLSGASAAVLNGNSSSNVANHSFWAGSAALEVKTKGGTGAFNDFMYLQHDAVSAAAAIRRLGILMKTGAETAGNAARSVAAYLYSNAVNGDNPELRFDVRDVMVWKMDPVNGSETPFPVHSNGSYLRATPAGTGGLRMSNTWLGTQGSGNHMYLRAATGAGFYFYSGGTHDDDQADANGGTTLATMQVDNGSALLTTGRLYLTTDVEANIETTAPSFMLGSAAGYNLIMDSSELMGRLGNAAFAMSLQNRGGELYLGGVGQDYITRVYINEVPFHIGTEPSNKVSNMVWINSASAADGGGVFRWNQGIASWVRIT